MVAKFNVIKFGVMGLAICLSASLSHTASVKSKHKMGKVSQTETSTEKNKLVVRRFNKEVIEEGNIKIFKELMDTAFVNHSAPIGADNGPAGMINTFNNLLRPALPDLKVTIYEQVAEGDLVTTRKNISGTHRGTLMGLAPTGRKVSIDVIDIVRIKNGKYYEHWGINTLPAVLAQLKNGN